MIITHSESKVLNESLDTIETLAADARIAVMGDAAKQKEYALAEQHAQDYKDAGFTGDVPAAVESWAVAKNWSMQKAAEDILKAAENVNDAILRIRDARLKAKEAVKSATSTILIRTHMENFKKRLSEIVDA